MSMNRVAQTLAVAYAIAPELLELRLPETKQREFTEHDAQRIKKAQENHRRKGKRD